MPNLLELIIWGVEGMHVLWNASGMSMCIFAAVPK